MVAAQTAALAAWRVTSLGDRVGAIVFSESAMDEIRPRARDAAVAPILNAIVRQNRALRADDPRPSDPGLINEALRKALRLMLLDGLVTLITDAAGANGVTVKLVTELTAHNDVLTVFIHDPLEVELPDLGRAVVAEAVRQMDIDMSGRALRARFAASFAERREAIERFSRRRAIPVLPLSTERDTAEQLRELLGRRLARSLAGVA